MWQRSRKRSEIAKPNLKELERQNILPQVLPKRTPCFLIVPQKAVNISDCRSGFRAMTICEYFLRQDTIWSSFFTSSLMNWSKVVTQEDRQITAPNRLVIKLCLTLMNTSSSAKKYDGNQNNKNLSSSRTSDYLQTNSNGMWNKMIVISTNDIEHAPNLT